MEDSILELLNKHPEHTWWAFGVVLTFTIAQICWVIGFLKLSYKHLTLSSDLPKAIFWFILAMIVLFAGLF